MINIFRVDLDSLENRSKIDYYFYEEQGMIKIYHSGNNMNCIFTVCIGDEYKERWERISLPFWKMYCERHGLSLIAMTSPYDDAGEKRVDWQKLLCGKAVKDSKLDIKNVCFVDFFLRHFGFPTKSLLGAQQKIVIHVSRHCWTERAITINCIQRI